ncbi:MAG: metalloregulator ArsR/SmtB family transcription factor [Ruminococcaceae bacterium]|nr:metalloregulator ArsR/SmtB family transcription factor [Oscillospiraceae bacterium]
MENSVVKILKLLSDETRLSIIRILAEEDSYVELIASRLSVTEATVCYHLKKMEQAGIVSASRSQFYIIYSLNRSLLEKSLLGMVLESDTPVETEERYRHQVIDSFFKYGKLVSIPVQQKKREIVLFEIAKDFSMGRDYSENEVNEIIHRYHEDHCTIRREMIAFGQLKRVGNVYSRGKGEFEQK